MGAARSMLDTCCIACHVLAHDGHEATWLCSRRVSVGPSIPSSARDIHSMYGSQGCLFIGLAFRNITALLRALGESGSGAM